jgi:acetyl-CoA decarbonylase/synthase complex subunit gamma
MALTGLQIYKYLPGGLKPPHPKANCKECGFPTCLAFAMKLAAKQAELSACPYVTDEARVELDSASAPPVRLITLSSDGHNVQAGNEIVLFRHEKTFYHPPGLFVRVRDTQPKDEVRELARNAQDYSVEYVGINLHLDGVAVESASGDAGTFTECVRTVLSTCSRPLILISLSPEVLAAGLAAVPQGKPLLYAATAQNWQAIVALAKERGCPLTVRANDLDGLVALVEQVKSAGIDDIVLDPGARKPLESLQSMTIIRRLALKKNFRPLGYPIITFPGEGVADPALEPLLAGQQIAKYGGFIVLDRFSPAAAYALLTLRQNIFTDPQKPIQVEPGIYEINRPNANSPVLVTTNFSITYFSVANEVEGSGFPGWLLVADAEGMSVLTAWAAGKFDADRIAKSVKETSIASKVDHRVLVIPGHVAVLLGELEEELPGWKVLVGPREAVDIPAFLKNLIE